MSNTNIKNKKVILKALRDLGVKEVSVCYSGSGDSGCIDHVDFGDNTVDKYHVVTVEEKSSRFDNVTQAWIETAAQKDVPICDAIESFCYDLLEEKHGGWENDAGADGSFTLNADTGQIAWNHNEYYTESNSYNYKV
jgi:hypothetical protein